MKYLFLALSILSFTPFTQASSGPRYLVEQIRVEGLRRTSQTAVLSVSQIEEGRSYTEREIQDAVSRIARLEYVLRVEYALESGSKGDARVLVLEVKEHFPLFFELHSESYTESGEDTDFQFQFEVGGRMFLGKSTLLELRGRASDEVDDIFGYDDPNTLTLSMTQFNLFGNNARIKGSAVWTEDTHRLFFSPNGSITRESEVSPSLNIFVPIRGNHAVTSDFSHQREKTRRRYGFDGSDEPLPVGRARVLRGNLGWDYNSLNDEVFPTQGRHVRAGLQYSDTTNKSQFFFFDDPTAFPVEWKRDGLGLYAQWTQYFQITNRQSVWYEASLAHDQGDVRADYSSIIRDDENPFFLDSVVKDSFQATVASARLGWGVDLWNQNMTQRMGNLRLEFEGRGSWNDFEFDDDENGDTDTTIYELEGRLSWRTSWGKLSGGLRYWELKD